MVYYYTSAVVDPPGFIYVGKDKFENEDLIKFGWDEDVWFHVDKLSSAHIYLRMNEGQQWDSLPENLVMDLAQLTKANSIEGSSSLSLSAQASPQIPSQLTSNSSPQGNKKDNITVIYTPWSNLKKDGSMDIGQVSFKNPRLVKRVLVSERENAIVNRLNKTKTEVKQPDFKQQKDDHDKEIRRKANAALQVKKKEEARQAQEWKEKKWQKEHAYDDLFTEENMDMQSNQNRSEDWEDDFM
ncbi:coiled-coil domain-containing protein [Beauveria bassiana ARSEF 2860]|uniref:Coiled-coil domain-containing protein n=1 Tax=Beauveria bassiana (strain ARSEF 2860) TaxID=655819 RepID=J4KLB3_BEAB2|nr:coiled-coil domain-containing protein [Beauveria bassiana ARSEF 2860]EJP61904.1 coiled-coil domain-containing protein [Beauveria bassiana ARSEF 2860]